MSSSRKKKSSNPTGKPLQTSEVLVAYVRMLIDIVVGLYVIVMLCILPFYMPEGYSGLGTNKAKFFEQWSLPFWKVMAVLLCFYLLVRMIETVRDKSAKRLTDFIGSISVSEWFLIGYTVVMLIATRISAFPDTAWTGTSGWYMGCMPQLLAIGAYFAVGRMSSDSFRWMLLGFPASAVVFFVGYMNRFELLKVANSTDVLRLSYIGNINWYCGYLVLWTGLGIGLYLLCRTGKGRLYAWASAFLGAYVTLCFGTLFTQQSDSGLLALGVVLLVLLAIYGKSLRQLRLASEVVILMLTALTITWALCGCGLELNKTDTLTTFLTSSFLVPLTLILLLALYLYSAKLEDTQKADIIVAKTAKGILLAVMAALVLWFVLTLYNTSTGVLTEKLGLTEDNAFVFNSIWGSRRGATWYASVLIWLEQDFLHKLFGVGGDCFYEAYMAIGGKVVDYVSSVFGTQRLTNAHGEYLTILVNFGLLGVVSFGGFIFTGMVRMLRAKRESDVSKVAFAAGLMLVAYTANNIFSFQQTTQMITMYILAGLGERALRGTLIEKD